MTPFEQGYDAFLKGVPKDKNPHDSEKCPVSLKRWEEGWVKARRERK